MNVYEYDVTCTHHNTERLSSPLSIHDGGWVLAEIQGGRDTTSGLHESICPWTIPIFSDSSSAFYTVNRPKST